MSIGNLLLLEQRINSSIPSGLSLDQKKSYYSDSKYTTVSEFIKEYRDVADWTTTHIDLRAGFLGERLYDKLVDFVNSIA